MAVSLSVCLFATSSIGSPGGTGRRKYTSRSVRALPIRVFTVGKKRSPAVQLLVDEYTSKLRHYCAVEDVQVRSNPRTAREKQAQIVDEDMAVMNLIKPDDWVVLLDEHGIEIESEGMAELIGGAADKVMDNPERAKVPSLAIPPSHLMLLLMCGVDFLFHASYAFLVSYIYVDFHRLNVIHHFKSWICHWFTATCIFVPASLLSHKFGCMVHLPWERTYRASNVQQSAWSCKTAFHALSSSPFPANFKDERFSDSLDNKARYRT